MNIDKTVRRLAAGVSLFALLERVCQEFELTDTQYENAKRSFETVGSWLAESTNPLLAGMTIYAHGSTGLLTANRPIRGAEHDVDLVSFAPHFGFGLLPSALKKAVGDRLREHGFYATILEEKLRCWRLNYAGSFYLDITPAIRNPFCNRGGELVPQKNTDAWKPSNPRGYRELFEARAKLHPRMRIDGLIAKDSTRAGKVEDFPVQQERKGVLRRIVQICKRHRDIRFENRDASKAPISIIITTLAARAYEHFVRSKVYDAEIDLVTDVIDGMPSFIDEVPSSGRRGWVIWNESTTGENFAEKWNDDPARAVAFFDWHRELSADLARLRLDEGLDQIGKTLGKSFGERAASAAMDSMTRELSAARTSGRLYAVQGSGLVAAAALPAKATPVLKNTHYGR